jgi:UBX domain-containing protein 1/4
MGITDVRARKGLVHGGNVEGAVVWISEHQDDPDIDQPYMVKKSDTIPKVSGFLLLSPSLSIIDHHKVPLTEEEKAAKLAAYKEKIERVKKEQEIKEKEDA